MKTIKILGAGISGLTSAINLAKKGYKIEVYEHNIDVGMRFQGDFQGLENWSEKEDILETINNIGVHINFECDPISKFQLFNGTKKWQIKTYRPAFYLIKRGNFEGSLDYGLKKQALKLGVKIHFSKTIDENKADIVATGPIHNQLGAIAEGIRFKTNIDELIVGLLDNKVAQKGYSYLLISKGYGTMCSCMFDNFRDVNQYYEKTYKQFLKNYKFEIKEPHKVAGTGTFSLKTPYQKNKSLYVGEAAGFQDFLWGFGMRYAFESGYIAAKCIIENKDYTKEINKKFKNKLKASVVNRYLWEKFGSKNYNYVIQKVYKSENILKTLKYFYNFNILQRMIYLIALRYCKKRFPHLKL